MKNCSIVFILTLLFSCNQSKPGNKLHNIDHLSKWFMLHEDSLINEFSNRVREDSLDKSYDPSWGERGYLQEDSLSYMGRFTLEARKFCDSLDVTFFYNKSSTPHTRILISTGYRREYAGCLDSLFNPIPKSKFFTIEKYEQPIETDLYSLSQEVAVNDLRLEIKPASDSLNDITLYIYSKPRITSMSNDEKELLMHGLFGEELIIKKINNIKFIFTDTIDPTKLTLSETLAKMNNTTIF
jgi:hypothetical protein